MDLLKRRRNKSVSTASVVSVSSASPSPSSAPASASPPGLQTDWTFPSSGANSGDYSHDNAKSGFFQAYVPKAIRSLGRSTRSSTWPATGASTTARARPKSVLGYGPTSPAVSPASPGPDGFFPPISASTSTSASARNFLRKAHKRVPSAHELLSRRASAASDKLLHRVSQSSATLSTGSAEAAAAEAAAAATAATPSPLEAAWSTQPVEKHCVVLFNECQPFRPRAGYLVLTSGFAVVFQSDSDAVAAFPQLSPANPTAAAFSEPPFEARPSSRRVSLANLFPAPSHVIPLHLVISAFAPELARPSNGAEIWWRQPLPMVATRFIQFFFSTPDQRDAYLDAVRLLARTGLATPPSPSATSPTLSASPSSASSKSAASASLASSPPTSPSSVGSTAASHADSQAVSRLASTVGPLVPSPVADCIVRIFRGEEPANSHSRPHIFPVVNCDVAERARSKVAMAKCEDKSSPSSASSSSSSKKMPRPDSYASYFFVVGVHLCYFVEIACASTLVTHTLQVRYQAYGITTLEAFRADWFRADERFSLTFREPFKAATTFQLASRHAHQLVHALSRADKFVKPAWPAAWQAEELFRLAGLRPPHHTVPGDDFGSFQRTLAAFCAAYRCAPVDWEVSWHHPVLAPEFRVLPAASGAPYSPVQLLAALRALRYNDYFRSLSFRDVDLSSLAALHDGSRKGSVAYLSRSGVFLTDHEIVQAAKGSVLYQELHALAFASEKICQIDLANCVRQPVFNASGVSDAPFLTSILNLLAAGLSRCNRLILKGCFLGTTDINSLVGLFAPRSDELRTPSRLQQKQQPGTGLQVLNVSGCGLPDGDMSSLFQALAQSVAATAMLEVLDVSQNPGRVSPRLARSLMASVKNLSVLNLSGSVAGSCHHDSTCDDDYGPLVPLESLHRLAYLEELNFSGIKLNQSTVESLVAYLASLGPGSRLRRIMLNGCGLTGGDAGRLVEALTALPGLAGVHLYLNSNPLEEGLDVLLRSLSASPKASAIGLHLDMIEFRDEANYVSLVQCLAKHPSFYHISLAGTAPMSTADGTCSDAICAALEELLANSRIQYLDLSGFRSKLDDSQLGRGVGRVLKSLAHNTSLTHLRMRNQRLDDSIDVLCSAIATNSGLRYFDCGGNDFSLANLQMLAESTEKNHALLVPVIAQNEAELDQLLTSCVNAKAQAASSTSLASLATVSTVSTVASTVSTVLAATAATTATSGLPPNSVQRRKKLLSADMEARRQKTTIRADFERCLTTMAAHAARNRAELQYESGCFLELDIVDDSGAGNVSGASEPGWPSLHLRPAVAVGEHGYDYGAGNILGVSMQLPSEGLADQQALAPAADIRPLATSGECPYGLHKHEEEAAASGTALGEENEEMVETATLEELIAPWHKLWIAEETKML